MKSFSRGGGGIYTRLEDHGHEFAEFVETLQARPTSKDEATEPALSPGAPMVHLIREALIHPPAGMRKATLRNSSTSTRVYEPLLACSLADRKGHTTNFGEWIAVWVSKGPHPRESL